MKEWRTIRMLAVVLAFAAVLGPISPVAAQVTTPGTQFAFSLQVTGDGEPTEVVTGGICRILTAGTSRDATDVYSDANLSTAISPAWQALDTNGVCKFWGSSNSYDVVVSIDSNTAGYTGAMGHFVGLTRQGVKRVRVHRDTSHKEVMIPWTSTGASRTFNLPAGAWMTDVVLETTTGVASSQLVVVPGYPGARDNTWCGGLDTRISSTTQQKYVYCAATAPTASNGALPHGTNAYAVQLNPQGHVTAGYAYLFYKTTNAF